MILLPQPAMDDIAFTSTLTWRERPRVSDIEAVRKIVARCGVFSKEEVRVAGELVEETLNHGTDNPPYRFVFATMSGQLTGYVCYDTIPLTDRRFDLYWIAVDPALQRIGIAAVLLARAEARIRERGGVFLYAETSGREIYEKARRFYLAHGFSEHARLPDFYREGDDKIIFRKTL